MTKIGKNQIEKSYSWSKLVFNEKSRVNEALANLRAEGMNSGSAKDYFRTFECMILGKQYSRTMNIEATKYYLAKIRSDFDHATFNNALNALQLHIDYYEGVGKSRMSSLRTVLSQFKAEEWNDEGRKTPAHATAGDDFDIASAEEDSETQVTEAKRREGQLKFRCLLLRNYLGICSISGENIEAVLEAAHIFPYRGAKSNHPQNGILLRADIHKLFDDGLISIDPKSYRILVIAALNGSTYENFRDKKLVMPKQRNQQPSETAIAYHFSNIWKGKKESIR